MSSFHLLDGPVHYFMSNYNVINENESCVRAKALNEQGPHLDKMSNFYLMNSQGQHFVPNYNLNSASESRKCVEALNEQGPHLDEMSHFYLMNSQSQHFVPNYNVNPENESCDRTGTLNPGELHLKTKDSTEQPNEHIHQNELERIISFEEDLLADKTEPFDKLHYIFDSSTRSTVGSPEIPEKIREHDNLIHVEPQVASLDHEIFTVGISDASSTIAPDDTTKSKQNSSTENVTPFNINVKSHQGCDNTAMIVPTSDQGPKTKKLCCVYCHKRYPKLVRHMQTVHKNEEDVKKFSDLPPGSKERRDVIDVIRKRGQFEWNTNSKINGGELSTSRRPNRKLQKKATDYKTCIRCLGTFTATNLRHHVNKCTNNALKGERVVTVLGRAVEGRLHATASDTLRLVIFPVMKEDEIVRSIRYDWLVIAFGNDLCLKYHPHFQHALIRSKLRQAGKLLHVVKGIRPEITDFSSIYKPKHNDSVIEAIRVVSNFDARLNQFESPATASTSATLIKEIGKMLVTEYIRREDPENQKRTEDFLTVLNSDVRNKINRTVADTQAKMRRERKEIIPTTDDVNRLSTYLDCEREKCRIKMTRNYSYADWVYLAELTMASIIVFSRKRIGEMQNVLVSDFHGREKINKANQVVKSRMKIRGKLGRTVPVLLKQSFEECIELLLHHRKDANVSDENGFLFALPSCSGKVKVVDGCAIMRKFSVACGAENSGSLRGTKLRKHVASFCVNMNLNDNDVAGVANFMGHNEKIHRDFYRHNTVHREVVQMTKLLEAAQGNRNTGQNTVDQNTVDQNSVDQNNVDQSTVDQNTEDNTITDADLGVDLSADGESNEPKIVATKICQKGKKIQEYSSDESGDDEAKVSATKISQKRKKNRIYSSEESGNDDVKTVATKIISQKRKKNRDYSSDDDEDLVPKKKFPKKRWDKDEKTSVFQAFEMYFRSRTLPTPNDILKKQKIYPSLKNRTHQQIKTWISNQYKKPK